MPRADERSGLPQRPSGRTGAAGRSALRAVALSLAMAVGLSAGSVVIATSASAAAVPGPASPVPAPAAVEGYSPYLPQASCDPVIKPGTAALRATLLAAYGGRDLGITRACALGALSEHKEGRAFDWGLSSADPAELALASQFLSWLLAPGPAGEPGYNAKRLGVMYVIWNGKIWGAYRSAEGWRTYNGGEAHAGHIHLSLSWNGATKRSSWWTGAVAPIDYGPCPTIQGEMAPRWTAPRLTPCPAPTPVISLTGTPLLGLNATSPYVRQLQTLLRVSPVSGFFGPVTDAALRAFQAAHGLGVTGTTTAATWAAVRDPANRATTPVPSIPAPKPTPKPAPKPAPKAKPRATPQPRTVADIAPRLLSRMTYTVRRGDSLSAIATSWRSNVSAIVAQNRLRGTTIRTGQVLTLPVRSWLTKYSRTTLRPGTRNRTVWVLQTALRMPTRYRTGLYATRTTAAVNAVKARQGWVRDGVVGTRFWRSLGA